MDVEVGAGRRERTEGRVGERGVGEDGGAEEYWEEEEPHGCSDSYREIEGGIVL